MPTFSGQSPATATDNVSIQNASGLIAQKSQTLSGPVITSDFTTTSTTLVDITGMTVTLAATNNVGSEVTVRIVYSNNISGTEVFSLNSTATKEYVWVDYGTGVTAFTASITRNADISIVDSGANADALTLDGFITGTTSGVVVKVQCSTSANTLTVKVGSVIYASF